MSWTRLTSAKAHGFAGKSLHRKKDAPRQTIKYMKQKSSFLIAALSLVAFMSGNMMGEHGWYAFWKAALGQYDDSLITYTGTVPPVAYVPDYSKWSTYGGNAEEHTYREVPQDALVSLPSYSSAAERSKSADNNTDVYSVGYMGDYKSGAEGKGSHPGVDIRVPEGTPIRSIANGIVESVRDDVGGFGKLIVIRHPHMPDPNNPDYETVLHSVYAHLSAQLVQAGDTVQKGQLIGLSGMTGDATGPHLHFQVDRDEAPWHPYWPFSGVDLKQASLSTLQAINQGFHQDMGYKYTVNPMLLAQADYAPAKNKQAAPTTVVSKPTTSSTSLVQKTLTLAQRVLLRRQTRSLQEQTVAAAPTVVVKKETVVTAGQNPPASAPVIVTPNSSPTQTVASLEAVTLAGGRFFDERAWQTVRLTFLDANGNTVTDPASLPKQMYIQLAYGDAEFSPATLSPGLLKNGSMQVQMLPHGRRTIVINLEPLHVTANPLQDSGH
jgi:murein DD-endopeptidase MepM/ murein hydrolase activator NlpD